MLEYVGICWNMLEYVGINGTRAAGDEMCPGIKIIKLDDSTFGLLWVCLELFGLIMTHRSHRF